MFAGKSRRRGFGLRAAVVLAATGALVFGGAAAASAKGDDGAKPNSSVKPNSDLPAGVAKIGVKGEVLVNTSAGRQPTPVAEFSLTFTNGDVRDAYCIDYHHPAGKGGTEYTAGKWDTSNVKNLPKIQWILSNSFPNVKDPAEVLKAAKVDTTGMKAREMELDAFAGTQTAIWHYSDGVELTGRYSGKNGLSEADYAAVKAVHDYLVDNAQKGSEPPAPQVSISPKQASGHTGEKVGPFTVTATGVKDVSVTTGNGQVVDADGKPVTSLGNGDKFWVKTDSAGSVTVTASGNGALPTGSVFMVKGHENEFQKLILADTATQKVGATVTVTVTAQPSASPTSAAPSASPSETSAAPASPSASGTAGGGLPVTGTSLPIIIGVALVLLVGGGAAVFMARRRRLTH